MSSATDSETPPSPILSSLEGDMCLVLSWLPVPRSPLLPRPSRPDLFSLGLGGGGSLEVTGLSFAGIWGGGMFSRPSGWALLGPGPLRVLSNQAAGSLFV